MKSAVVIIAVFVAVPTASEWCRAQIVSSSIPGLSRLDFRGRQRSVDPLPFQAVRIQLTLRNAEAPSVEDLPYLEHLVLPNCQLKGPGDDQFRKVEKGFQWLGAEVPYSPLVASTNHDLSIRLTAGEESSVSFAVAADWLKDGKSLFSVPGDYALRFEYPAKDGLVADVSVHVREPCGDDRRVWELLRDDPELAVVMMSANAWPDEQTAKELSALVKQYPKSSYADYARFARARAELHGTGFWALEWSDQERPEESIRKLSLLLPRDGSKTDDELWQLLDGSPFLFGKLQGESASIVRAAIAARNGSDDERKAAFEKVVELLYISPRERLQAATILRQIQQPWFPYQPNVLCVRRIALKGLDRKEVAEIDRIMADKYADSVQWIQLQEQHLHWPREWRDFRVQFRKPTTGY